ncbi:hypothetical protein [Azospira restricta]|uniref:Uncharacterized protein n=1 Tax=Azospira restricta TaxID=404405 RepID=A0A974Y606_9RHOO|nr:hypothetical protein [Azospira restricta]QRJ65811.1 hypothetical protein IWH25_11785 [Azospira restricta]
MFVITIARTLPAHCRTPSRPAKVLLHKGISSATAAGDAPGQAPSAGTMSVQSMLQRTKNLPGMPPAGQRHRPPEGPGASRARYNSKLSARRRTGRRHRTALTRIALKMEAEQLNSIANRLADLAQRSGELRRYL